MSSPHRIRHDLYRSPTDIKDPGNGGTITIDKDGGVCSVVTAAAETRTLKSPTKAGIIGNIVLDDDGGTLTVTVTGGFNSADDTTIVLDDAGDFARFLSIKVGSSYLWRLISQGGSDEEPTTSALMDDPGLTFTSHAWDGSTYPTAAEGNKLVADIADNNEAIEAIIDALVAYGILVSP